MYRINKLDVLHLGIKGENKATTIRIDVPDWLSEFPSASFTIAAIRPTEHSPYIAESYLDGVILNWNITSADVGINGNGSAEIRAMQGDVIKKSLTVKTLIYDCMNGTDSPVPPSPYDAWFDRLVSIQNDVDTKSEEIKSYSAHPPEIGGNGYWMLWNGKEYVETDFPARGEKGDRGERGLQGVQGIQGERGERGFTGPRGEIGKTGPKGATFTPHVSSSGIISWTNDGALENPPPVDIYSLVMASIMGGDNYDIFVVKK